MAAALLSSSLPQNNSISLSFFIFRNHAQSSANRRQCLISGKLQLITLYSSHPICKNHLRIPESVNDSSLNRRDVMLFALASSASLIFPSPAAIAVVDDDDDIKMASMVDDINAYSFLYPLELPSKKFLFKWVESRKPERYSSAAPLSPDARQRIVSERVDIIDNVVISVSIGPPNARFLTSKDKNTWSPKDVADAVLSDKLALRITPGQRMSEISVLHSHSSKNRLKLQYELLVYRVPRKEIKVDGEPYWYYEYLVRKSPSKSAQEPNLYRHFVASTAERDGYLYSLSASTLSKKWDFMGPILEKTVASFHLLPPTESYVPAYKDPWRFW